MSIMAPGTTPPPRTRSSSPMPVVRRNSAEMLTLSMGTGVAGSAAGMPGRATAVRTNSSTRVSHWPHSGQRPSHLGLA